MIETINTIILGITAYIIWIYTKAAQKSNDIQEQPVLNLTIATNNNSVNTWFTLNVKNVGHSPAYNIKIKSLENGDFVYHPYFRDGANPTFEVGDEKELIFWVKIKPNKTEAYDRILGFLTFLQRFFPRNTEKYMHETRKRTGAIFLINYEGIDEKKYHSIFRIYSTIWPVLETYDLVSEFIHTGENHWTPEKAEEFCSKKESIGRFS